MSNFSIKETTGRIKLPIRWQQWLSLTLEYFLVRNGSYVLFYTKNQPQCVRYSVSVADVNLNCLSLKISQVDRSKTCKSGFASNKLNKFHII